MIFFFYVFCGLDIGILSIIGVVCARADRTANDKYGRLQDLEFEKFKLYYKYKSISEKILEKNKMADSCEDVCKIEDFSDENNVSLSDDLGYELDNKVLIKKRKNSL